MTRAAVAAQQHPGRLGGRSASPLLPSESVKTTTITEETETFSVIPGKGDVPALPKGANGSFESLDELGVNDVSGVEVLRAVDEREEFEWPDDVF